MEALLGKNIDELKAVCAGYDLKSFVATQMADWLYSKRVRTIDEMTNISKAARAALSQDYEVGRTGYCDLISSSDGTKKYLFPFGPGVEAVMIPDGDRHTVCVSSQMGCRMGCRFCMTGRQGWHGNLTPAEILSQFMEIDEAASLTNRAAGQLGQCPPGDRGADSSMGLRLESQAHYPFDHRRDIGSAHGGIASAAFHGRMLLSSGREPAQSFP